MLPNPTRYQTETEVSKLIMLSLIITKVCKKDLMMACIIPLVKNTSK